MLLEDVPKELRNVVDLLEVMDEMANHRRTEGKYYVRPYLVPGHERRYRLGKKVVRLFGKRRARR